MFVRITADKAMEDFARIVVSLQIPVVLHFSFIQPLDSGFLYTLKSLVKSSGTMQVYSSLRTQVIYRVAITEKSRRESKSV